MEGIRAYRVAVGLSISDVTWKSLCDVSSSEALVIPDNLHLDVLVDRELREYLESESSLQPRSNIAQEVEDITRFNFDSNAFISAPDDLFRRQDKSTGPRVKPQYIDTARHSELSCFFLYLPVSFWEMVLHATNVSAEKLKVQKFTLDELMKFLGILFYMAVVDKGEYKNYWGPQVEDAILGNEGSTADLSSIMTLRRFTSLRQHLSFRLPVSDEDLKKDAAAKIRPLISMLKIRCPEFVDVGRNIAVDEASVACRSKFARHLILYNPQKPTGVYYYCHFIINLINLFIYHS